MKVLLFLCSALTLAAQPSRGTAPKRGGLIGYISASVEPAPKEFGYGFSYYTTIFAIVDPKPEKFQVGLCGTWLMPDNDDFTQPLLPLGAGTIREHSPERAGKYWREVFQTIEGGSGITENIRFPGALPKLKIGGTPNGYVYTLNSTGWTAGRSEGVPREQMGVAQLSNRLLIPPDGIGYPKGTDGQVTGVAWMALPLTPARRVDGVPVGDQSWTLFLNLANFKGPWVFWIPDVWTRLSRDYPVIQGRGLDARRALMPGTAIELGNVQGFERTAANGATYMKIPRLHFPVDEKGRTYLNQDVTIYSKAALFNDVKAWIDGGPAPSGRFGERGVFKPELKAQPLSFRQGTTPATTFPIDILTDRVQTQVVRTPGSSAFVLQWRDREGAGTLPEYYERAGRKIRPVAAEKVPADTGLAPLAFNPSPVREAYTSPGVLPEPAPRAGPLTTRMLDGSVVTYAWYRFADQPALQGLGWSAADKERLQQVVEKMHAAWSGTREFLPPPSRGALSSIDPGALVTPPPGLEVGYVPIVLRQEAAR